MTQNELVLQHLTKYGSLTSGEAWSQYGISRLESRICDLKRWGISLRRTPSEFRPREVIGYG